MTSREFIVFLKAILREKNEALIRNQKRTFSEQEKFHFISLQKCTICRSFLEQ